MSAGVLLWILGWNVAAFCLRSVGALLGMGFFRHKTRHWTFRLGMPAILILQVAALTTWTYWDVFLR